MLGSKLPFWEAGGLARVSECREFEGIGAVVRLLKARELEEGRCLGVTEFPY